MPPALPIAANAWPPQSAKMDLDEWLANLPEGAVIKGDPKHVSAMLREANKNYAAAERAEEITRRLMRAELRCQRGRFRHEHRQHHPATYGRCAALAEADARL